MLTLDDFTYFAECLPDAVTRAEAGFHFEEGGCWGMAAALREHFIAQGAEVVINHCPAGWVHAWVEVLGRPCDHTGEMMGGTDYIRSLAVELADERALLAACVAHGIPEDQFFADKAWAQQVIAFAVEGMSAPLPSSLAFWSGMPD